MICWYNHPILFKERRKKAIVLSSFVFVFYSVRFSNPPVLQNILLSWVFFNFLIHCYCTISSSAAAVDSTATATVVGGSGGGWGGSIRGWLLSFIQYYFFSSLLLLSSLCVCVCVSFVVCFLVSKNAGFYPDCQVLWSLSRKAKSGY